MGAFEPLATSFRPARLKQVLKSIRIHDQFVKKAVHTSKRRGWSQEMKERGGPYLTIGSFLPGSDLWKQTRQLSVAWEKGPQRRAATEAEFRDFRADMIRRLQVRLVNHV